MPINSIQRDSVFINTMLVKDIMVKKVITVNPDTPISEAAELLEKNNINGMPVIKNNSVVGIVTESDFILKHLRIHLPSLIKILPHLPFNEKSRKQFARREYADLTQTMVKDIMTTPVITVTESADIGEVAKLFGGKVNPLPVVDKNNNLVGIISKADLLKFYIK